MFGRQAGSANRAIPVFSPSIGPFNTPMDFTLTVRVISAQQLPKPGGKHKVLIA
jgi:hypothetical protein